MTTVEVSSVIGSSKEASGRHRQVERLVEVRVDAVIHRLHRPLLRPFGAPYRHPARPGRAVGARHVPGHRRRLDEALRLHLLAHRLHPAIALRREVPRSRRDRQDAVGRVGEVLAERKRHLLVDDVHAGHQHHGEGELPGHEPLADGAGRPAEREPVAQHVDGLEAGEDQGRVGAREEADGDGDVAEGGERGGVPRLLQHELDADELRERANGC
jgi:hypothetical protein